MIIFTMVFLAVIAEPSVVVLYRLLVGVWQTIRYHYELQVNLQKDHAAVARGKVLPHVLRVPPWAHLRSPFQRKTWDTADYDRILDTVVPEASQLVSFTHFRGQGSRDHL